MAVALHRSTGQKANTCLVIWHVVNSFVLSLMIALVYFYISKINKADEDNINKVTVQYLRVSLAVSPVAAYVDLFFIFLLYKFMRPQ